MAWDGYGWRPYVPVAKRRAQTAKKMEALRKKGVDIQPIEIQGLKIAKTFWGQGWCDHLESFSDYENRLPRGRTYVRNGSVCHLAIKKGNVEAKVSGSEIYNIQIQIKTLPAVKWNAVKQKCAGQIGSLLELLRGDLSGNIMEVVTDRETGLFPLPGEISFKCDCPDWAVMCKHVAAVLYGVGARLDNEPALLFHLRGVNHDELIDVDAQVAVAGKKGRGDAKRLASDDLGDVFGIDLESDAPEAPAKKKSPATKKRTVKAKAPSKRSTKSQASKIADGKNKAAKTTKRQSPDKKSAVGSATTVKSTKSSNTATKTTAKKKTAKKRARSAS